MAFVFLRGLEYFFEVRGVLGRQLAEVDFYFLVGFGDLDPALLDHFDGPDLALVIVQGFWVLLLAVLLQVLHLTIHFDGPAEGESEQLVNGRFRNLKLGRATDQLEVVGCDELSVSLARLCLLVVRLKAPQMDKCCLGPLQLVFKLDVHALRPKDQNQDNWQHDQSQSNL